MPQICTIHNTNNELVKFEWTFRGIGILGKIFQHENEEYKQDANFSPWMVNSHVFENDWEVCITDTKLHAQIGELTNKDEIRSQGGDPAFFFIPKGSKYSSYMAR